jgi:hypothetical protein
MEDTMRKTGFALASLLLSVLALSGGGPEGALAATGDTLIVTGDGVNVRYGPGTDAKVRMQVSRGQLVSEIERRGEWVRAEIAGSDGASGWIHSSLLAVPSADQLERAHKRASQPPGAGLPEAKPPAPPGAASTAPAAPTPATTPPAPAKPQASQSSSSDSPAGAPSTSAAASAAEPVPDMGSSTDESPTRMAVAPPAAPADTDEQAAVTPAAGPTEAADAAQLARFRDSVDYLNSRSNSVAGGDLFDGVEAVGDGVVQVGATDAWSTIPPAGQQSYVNTLVDRWAAARGYSGPATVRIVGPDGKVLLESKKP